MPTLGMRIIALFCAKTLNFSNEAGSSVAHLRKVVLLMEESSEHKQLTTC